MKITPDCIVCNLNTGLMAIREVTADEGLMRELTAEIMKLPAVQGLDWSITGSQLVEQIFRTITEASGNPDPFRRWKEEHNEKCLTLYPLFRKLVMESEDPVFTAINLAIMGNSIDPMGHENPHDIELAIRASLTKAVPRSRFRDLKERLEHSSLVLYLGDNCGEIVYDKLLIETIKSHYNIEVVFVVRSVPTLNDATLSEAKLVGMDEAATVVENGIAGPLPGTIFSRCSAELRSLWLSADLVMSKGGGNFDTLDEEENLTTPLFYMLMSKCIPYRDYFNIPLHYPILSRAAAR
jgi:damage-control phosphatase, subfamily I